MKNYSHIVNDICALKLFLCSSPISEDVKTARSVFIQVFSSRADRNYLESVVGTIQAQLPEAVVVGSTTVGEISEGGLQTGTTVLSLSFFEKSEVIPIALSCFSDGGFQTGRRLIREIHGMGPDVAGVLMFATSQSVDVAAVLKGMSRQGTDFPVFGGCAGIYDRNGTGLIFCESNYISQGVIAVVFLGENLHIHAQTYLGWQPLSKEMTITDADNMLVRTVDNVSAFDIYHRYLAIQNDKDFFNNVLEFPFLLERDGKVVARVPSVVEENKGIRFLSDFKTGEKFRIGYGDPEIIIRDSKAAQKAMSDFEPNAIFLYSCVCRRFLMQSDVDLETQPYEAIAPTAGFYTYGEIYAQADQFQYLNSTIVVVGMREGDRDQGNARDVIAPLNPPGLDPYANKHNLIVSRLLHFIHVVSSELEQANQDLTRLSKTDMLTQIYNRMMLDDILQSEIDRSERYERVFSLILMDIDSFKHINDHYGHIAGDDVLICMADILRKNVRNTDAVGRWGGDEFLIILPETKPENAAHLAQTVRAAIIRTTFPVSEKLTCSFGVAGYHIGDDKFQILARADKALYEAKKNGRNRMVLSESRIEPYRSVIPDARICKRQGTGS